MLGAMSLRRAVSLLVYAKAIDEHIADSAFFQGFPTDMTTPVTKAWEHTNGVMPRTLVPAQRMGAADELAGTILYLASKAGGYTNGNISLIDGGFLANHAGTY